MPVSVGRASVPHSVKKVVREFAPGDSDVKEGGIPESWHYHVYLTEDWDQYFRESSFLIFSLFQSRERHSSLHR
jgi:hypothetical protein